MNDRVTFCVRPERLRVVDTSGKRGRPDAPNVLEASVSKTEFLGESTRSYLEWNGRELRVRSSDPLAGDVRVWFDPTDAHIVEIDGG